MRGIKDLIARRRPVSGPLVEDTGDRDAPEPLDDWERLQDRLAQERQTPPRHSDLETARAARNHVPRPERPRPSPRQEWLPPEQDAPEIDDIGGLLDLSDEPDATPPAASGTPRIWDIDPEDPATAPAPEAPASALARSAAAMSAPRATSQPARPASQRVKTRLLGFHAEASGQDLFDTAPATSAAAGSDPWFPIGWLVVVDGPGRGASFTLTAGLSTVGRDPGQTVSLDFGDATISRERHLCIAYDDEDNRAYVGHGGKANIVRLNDRPLLSTEDLNDGDTIRIGKTVLRFVAFCTGGFSWAADAGDDDA
ncbi:FHA domain-containing protein [Maliponia aquimaris]|uniref:FHA domain-containing protein n=1 Tax=Maliponia aquimaris TaxID=1673631 RepID=A0A238L4X6_9RHOB|nr:FHA domain-containing protein [Maliponia aquimaris]SMX50143.1 hypothetical protein MAA8898_04625 [Maliponia aquimaris]